jgi:release factor glutamine methyltransferase
MLLAHALRLNRIDLYLQYDRPLNRDELAVFKSLIQRRCKKEPVAYILGRKGFWNHEFEVGPSVLIPRPDTECLLEAVLALLPRPTASHAVSSHPKYILELGTGSGAVIISLAAERPHAVCFATDRSLDAVWQARSNALQQGLADKIHFCVADWLDAFQCHQPIFDIICSNPPYIPTEEIQALQPEIRYYEPFMALDGRKDGLCAIRHLIHQAHFYLKAGGALLLEIGHDQQSEVSRLITACDHYEKITFIKDYAGKDRVVQMIKK